MHILAVIAGAVSIWLGTTIGWSIITGHWLKGFWPKASLAWVVAAAVARITPWGNSVTIVLDCYLLMWAGAVLGGGQLGWLYKSFQKKGGEIR